MAWGFVYVLGNDSMPGIYKIGMTEKAPMERMEQLSMATACPTPFWLAMFAQVEDPRSVESEVHAELDRVRVNRSREFFRASLRDIAIVLGQCCEGETHWAFDGQYKSWREDEAQELDEKTEHFFAQCADPIDWTRRGFQ